MERRDFLRYCSAAAAAAGAPALAADLRPQYYARAKLLDAKGAPLRPRDVPPDRNLIFHYPYAATPCFLLNLGKPVRPAQLRTSDNRIYEWNGGVGPSRSIVAYSAICAHKMTYPTRQVSFIGYRDAPSPVAGKGKVITCCSDRSVYDPAAGARVVSGPAPQPLATILLEHDAKADETFAVGTFGGEMFAEFFRKYEFRLQLEMGNRATLTADKTAAVRRLENYSTQWAQC